MRADTLAHRLRLALATLVLGAAGAASAAAPVCARGALVDAGFRDAALATLAQLAIHAPGQAAHGAVKSNLSPGYVDPGGARWHFISAYQVNLALAEALRVAPSLLPVAAEWLRWQSRHTAPTGPGQGVVFDHWVREADLHVAPCPVGRPADECPHVDAYDSTAASLLLMAEAYRAAGGDAALLREAGMRASLQASVGTMVALTQPEGLSSAKPGYAVDYLMDAVEVAAGWRAWAGVQQQAYADGPGAARSLAAAQRTEDAVRTQLWHAPSQAWRVSLQAGPPDFARWYADTVAQAWPLLWGVAGPAPADAAAAWRQAARRWQGQADWSRRNVDPDGFWWPAVAVAARCTGDEAAARTWVARARGAWLRTERPFAWPFQVGDLRWLLWLSDPVP
ncbi:hypothetical protein [Pseudorhodoferax sp. Leaf267]|uniref:hypothetical protein n=1 Tax=Pseudorhodoferax sp. Leaf267 TaxID=1736316 RepID=UPI000700A02D|nr:hypothetical protein [Pseudorhodoferax sp. Leaf267]KQP13105.1 hypothetical protein ASF43_18500 [Pseudorhodoferax sp. Leaf267]